MPYSLSIVPAVVAPGDPVLISLICSRGERRCVTWWALHHEDHCCPSVPFPGEPVSLTLTRLGVHCFSAENPAAVNGDRVLDHGTCLVTDPFTVAVNACLNQELPPRREDLHAVCALHNIADADADQQLDHSLSRLMRATADADRRRMLFDVLTELYARPMIALAVRRGFYPTTRVSCDDIYQEARLRALDALPQFLNDPSCRPFGPWFRTITQRVALDAGRRLRTEGKHRVPLFDNGGNVPGGPEDDEGRDDSDEIRQKISRVLMLLPPADRQILREKFYKEWTLKRMAKRRRIPKEQIPRLWRRIQRILARARILYDNLPSDNGGGE